jgi:hypothetical protein
MKSRVWKIKLTSSSEEAINDGEYYDLRCRAQSGHSEYKTPTYDNAGNCNVINAESGYEKVGDHTPDSTRKVQNHQLMIVKIVSDGTIMGPNLYCCTHRVKSG